MFLANSPWIVARNSTGCLAKAVHDSVVAWIEAEMEFALSQAVASGDAFEHTGRPSAVIVFRTFWPTLISVICLEKLRDLSLGPITLFQRPICVSIRLRWLYPVATCQAMRPLLRIWAIWRSRTVGCRADCGRITAFFGGLQISLSRDQQAQCSD